MADTKQLINREDSLLIVIDAQEKLMPAVAEKEKVTANLIRLVKFANIIKLPVMVTEQEKLGPTLPEISREIPHEKPIKKINFDCFACTDFNDHLAKQGRSILLLAGLESHICVAQTALSGLAKYRVQVISDATSSRSRDNWQVALQRLSHAGVVISSTEMLIYELLQKAGTDEFRATLPLVKD